MATSWTEKYHFIFCLFYGTLGLTDEEKAAMKREHFFDFLATIGSVMYGMLIFLVGIICYMFDLFGPLSKGRHSHLQEGLTIGYR